MDKSIRERILDSKITYVIISLLGTLTLGDTLSFPTAAARDSVAYSNSFLSLLVFIFSTVCLWMAAARTENKEKRSLGLGIVYSLGLGTALVAGHQLETVGNFDVARIKSWVQILILGLYFLPLVRFGWQWLAGLGEKEEKKEAPVGSHFLRNWIILFLCWVPVFLAVYPGAFVYDAQEEYVQVASRVFTTHHPLLHVLLLGGFVCAGNKFFGSFNLGIAFYTLFQMLILSGVFSYTIVYLEQKGKRRGTWLAALFFYGFFPVIPMYAVCSAKDGLFTATFLVVVVQMLLLFDEPGRFFEKKRNVFAVVLASVLMMLLRNNGCYAYIVWGIGALAGITLLYRNKRHTLQLAAVWGISLVLFFLSSGLLTALLSADSSESQEIMTVPIQQLARTYNYSPESFTQEEKETLYEILSEEALSTYNPKISDVIKSKFNNQKFNENKGKYLALWVKIGLRKPLIYLNGWLLTSYGFWYPDSVLNAYGGNTVYTYTYEDSSYFGFETEPPGVRSSKFPWLEEQYRKLSLELYQQKAAGISMLFSPGFLFWVYAYACAYLLWKKEAKKLVPLALIFLLWLTVLLGPTCLVRYVLILWFALPVFVFVI